MSVTVSQLRNLVIQDIEAEMEQQDAKWGLQHHNNGTGSWDYSLRAESEKSANDEAVKRDALTWSGILLEEVYEALAEKGQVRLREELIQSAAVIVQWVADLDRTESGVPW